MEDRGELSKTGEVLRNVGLILSMIGIFFLFIVFFPFLTGITLNANLQFIFQLIGVPTFIGGFIMFFISNFLRIFKKYEAFSFLKCAKEECNYEEVRDFRRGDHVFKDLERACKTCGSHLYIHQIANLPLKIYKIKEHNIKERSEWDDEKKIFVTKTVLKCVDPTCTHEEVRDFQVGDTVFMESDGVVCKKCNSKLYVHEIYHISEEKFNKLKQKGLVAA